MLPTVSSNRPVWATTRFTLDLRITRVMGVVNLTPDSFSGGGLLNTPSLAIRHAEKLLREGADLLDLGAESSRPGAQSISAAEEWSRLVPVLSIALQWGIPISVDTVKLEVMRRALDLGVDIINDIHAFGDPRTMDLVAQHACGLCLMHMRGSPETMQTMTDYKDVVAEVAGYLRVRAQQLLERQVQAQRLVLDPGIGFGKTPDQNQTLWAGQSALLALGYPVLAGWSRKSTLGVITGKDVADRLVASVAAALAAVEWGARVVRVHDVGATVDALKVWRAAGLGDAAPRI